MKDLLIQMGQRLSSRRKQLGLSQERLAELVDVSSQMISSAELGKKAMRPENIVRICAALDISTDYLLTGKVTELEFESLTAPKIRLTWEQYRCLENIIDNFFAALCCERGDAPPKGEGASGTEEL